MRILRKICYLLVATAVLWTGFVFAQETITNPLVQIDLAKVGSVQCGTVGTNKVFTWDRAITNGEVARRLFMMWQKAPVGSARYAALGVGQDFYVFRSTNGTPIAAVWFPYLTQPRGATPYSVSWDNGEVRVGMPGLPPKMWLLKEIDPSLGKELLNSWVLLDAPQQRQK